MRIPVLACTCGARLRCYPPTCYRTIPMRYVLPIAVAMLVTGCSGSPTSPSPTTTAPTVATTFDVAVTVATPRGSGVVGATLEILDGTAAGQTFTTGANGRITLTGAQGNMNIEARAAGCASARAGVGPPTGGTTQSLAFTLQTPDIWRQAGQGNTVFDLPLCVDRVRITGRFTGSGTSNFILRIGGRLVVNEILRDGRTMAFIPRRAAPWRSSARRTSSGRLPKNGKSVTGHHGAPP